MPAVSDPAVFRPGGNWHAWLVVPAARHVRVGLSLILSAMVAAGCTEAPEKPSQRDVRATQSPSPPRCEPTPVKANFKFTRSVPASDRSFVRKVSRQAISYFRLRTTHCVERDPVDVRVYAKEQGNLVGRAHYGEIEVFAESPAWEAFTIGERAQVLLHEWYHVLQRTLSTAPPPPTWFFEGSAEWAAFDAAVQLGYFESMDYVREFLRFDARRPPAPLHRAKPVNPGVYSLFFTGVDFLLNEYGGKKGLRLFWQRYKPGDSWKAVFRSVFKVKVSSFLEKYEAHRAAGFTG